jgi:hypothetical protein
LDATGPHYTRIQPEINNAQEDEEHEQGNLFYWSYKEDEEPLPIRKEKKRKACVVLEIPKKPKSSTALVIQEQITKIVESTSSFTSNKEGGVTI